MTSITKLIFRGEDNPILTYLNEEGE